MASQPPPPPLSITQPNLPPTPRATTQHLAGTSQSWTSPAALQSAKFQRLQNNANHLGFAASPFFPKTAGEYARHQAEYAQERMEGEKERLRCRIQERECRRRVEGDRVLDREVVMRENQRLRGLVCGEDDGEELAEERDGDGKEVGGAVEELGAQIENENEEGERGEQVDSGTNDNESIGKSSKRKNHRGKKSKGSKAKNKIEDSEAAKPEEDIEHARTASKKNTADLATTLLGSMANDPLLKGVLAGTAKPPNSSLWKAFTQSSLYNPSGSAPALNAMFASLQKPGHTTVLGAPTNIWAGDEHLKPEGRRDPKTGAHRSAWPELSEMKAEGHYRKEAGNDRRLPLPRKDLMNKEAVIREAGGQEVADMLSEAGVDAVCRDLMHKTGEEIAWMDREPVVFGGFDRLESVEKERREDIARRSKGGSVRGHGAQGTGQRGHGPNMGLRGGFSQSGQGRRYTGAPLPGPALPGPTKPKSTVVYPEAIAYGADGPGSGKVPPPGGWAFDEDFLKQKGEWEDLLENNL
ncbi:hypothetical protein N431DRAFT_437476 [Stipitochalara longipes BDJ]|nr:hypothetical protein N431DRAFT_437476 [Stipitochalara longipes BDJ]